MNKKCLIIDEMHESIIPLLEEAGMEPDYQPLIHRQELLKIIPEYGGLIVRSKTAIDKEVVTAGKNLQFVARAGAGIDKLDVEELERRNVVVINAPEGNRDALGEHAVGMLLSLLNKIHTANLEVKRGVWDREGNRGLELMAKTVAIIGYGHMGKAFAQRLSSFGCKVVAYDKYKTGYSDQYAKEVTLDQVFVQADIVSFHVPLTEETRNFVNEKFLNNFKKEIYLINTARGEIISLKVLIDAMKSGKVKGAALDVLENEKIGQLTPEQIQNFKFLVQSENVLLTPHIAGWSHESYLKINQVLVEKIKFHFFI